MKTKIQFESAIKNIKYYCNQVDELMKQQLSIGFESDGMTKEAEDGWIQRIGAISNNARTMNNVCDLQMKMYNKMEQLRYVKIKEDKNKEKELEDDIPF